jgi:hypothetical protein
MTRTALSVLLAACLGSAADAPRALDRKGPASVWATVPEGDPPALRLSDELTLTLRVKAPAPLEVELADKPRMTDLWVLERKGAARASVHPDNGEAIWEQDLLLAPRQPGDQTVELPALRYRSGGGPWKKVVWAPLTVRITTRIATADPTSARDITGTEDLPPAAPRGGWLVWAGVGVAVLLLAGLGMWLGRRRPPKAPPLPPHRWALRELEALATRAPRTGEEVEKYHTALSAVVRRYLERRFLIPAERQTTAEFLEAVRQSSDLSEGQRGSLGELLGRCDLAKFARVWPPPEECQALLAEARRFIEETAPPEPPSAA